VQALAGKGHLPEDVAILNNREGDLVPAFVKFVELDPALLEDEEPLGALLGAVEDVAFIQEGVGGALGQIRNSPKSRSVVPHEQIALAYCSILSLFDPFVRLLRLSFWEYRTFRPPLCELRSNGVLRKRYPQVQLQATAKIAQLGYALMPYRLDTHDAMASLALTSDTSTKRRSIVTPTPSSVHLRGVERRP
jgi:hypothetical protein